MIAGEKMIYDYYCVDCGRKHRGEEISFDLAEFLGLKNVLDSTGSVTSVTLVSVTAWQTK